jgi:hypothetical protein
LDLTTYRLYFNFGPSELHKEKQSAWQDDRAGSLSQSPLEPQNNFRETE